MPFTLAHPAVIIPFLKVFKNRISLTGLIIGSIVPDFEYLFNIVQRSVISHTAEGIIYFNIPVAIFLSVCWHGWVKQVLIPNLPARLQVFFLKHLDLNWFVYLKKNWHIYLLSLMMGICLHVLWDSFSHANGYFVVHYKFMHQTLLLPSISLYRLSWWISSLAGIYFVWKFALMFKEESLAIPISVSVHSNFWPMVYLLSCLVLFWEWKPFIKPFEFRYLLVAGVGAVLFSVIIISFIYRFVNGFKND